MLGYAFMGKAHSNAFKKIAYMTWPPPLDAEARRASPGATLQRSARRPSATATTTRRATGATSSPTSGSGSSTTAARTRCTPSRPIAAAEAGKHVICEKPLGRDADESYEIWQRVAATGVKHLCAFNYRFVPAVRLAREMIEAGELGEIRHFRGRYLQDWADDATLDTWRFHPDEAGSGALGDIGTHVIDLGRFLNGEITSVSGFVKTFVPGRTVDDALEAAVEFENGSVGTIEGTRLALGRRNAFQWEINGSKGSLAFDMERLNELQVFRADGDRARGFKTVLVSETEPSVLGALVAARPHHRLGRHVRARAPPHAEGDRRRHGRRPVRRDLRGRLPRLRGRRRDRALRRDRASASRSRTEPDSVSPRGRASPCRRGGRRRPRSGRAARAG